MRSAFRKRGHEAWSCDLLPCEDDSPFHFQGDCLQYLNMDWDLMICHPPCTHLAISGAKHFEEKRKSGVQQEALDFVQQLLNADIPRIALENPKSIISTQIRKPDQIIQPWQFGHAEYKGVCLWLKNLPLLVPTKVIVLGREHKSWRMPPSDDRWKERSRTHVGIARAMAKQWGTL